MEKARDNVLCVMRQVPMGAGVRAQAGVSCSSCGGCRRAVSSPGLLLCFLGLVGLFRDV